MTITVSPASIADVLKTGVVTLGAALAGHHTITHQPPIHVLPVEPPSEAAIRALLEAIHGKPHGRDGDYSEQQYRDGWAGLIAAAEQTSHEQHPAGTDLTCAVCVAMPERVEMTEDEA